VHHPHPALDLPLSYLLLRHPLYLSRLHVGLLLISIFGLNIGGEHTLLGYKLGSGIVTRNLTFHAEIVSD
jgi:hypothetical protein